MERHRILICCKKVASFSDVRLTRVEKWKKWGIKEKKRDKETILDKEGECRL